MPSLAFRTCSALVGASALLVGPFVVPASAAPVTIQVVAISDFHGRLEPIDETETDPPLPVGGAVQLASAVDALTAANPNTIFASAGDNIGASTFTSNVQQDAPTIEALNEAGLAVSAVGNHEFDRGFDDIANGGRVDDLADFPYLGANVYRTGSQDPVLDATSVVTTPSGVTVGFVGVVTEETASLVDPSGIAAIEFGDEAAAANREAARLSDGDAANGEADVVVLLMHDGSDEGGCAGDATLRALSEDVDAVVAGHTHQSYLCNEFTGSGGFTGPVVQAGEYGSAVGVITLTVDDATGELTAARAEVRELTGFVETGARATAVAATVAEAVAFAEEAGAVPLGEITADIPRAFTADGSENRGAESVLGNFIADVQLAQTSEAGAQIAFMNPGGLRDDFLVADQFADEPAGVVTLGEANAVQPFANGVVTLTLTGAQVEDVLEEQWQPEGASRPFLALGVSDGFFYTYDPERPRGDRITSVTLDGEPLEADEDYRVTVNSFLAAGGDNFSTLAEGTERQELGVTDLEALVAYLDENSPVTADRAPRRALGEGAVVVPTPGPTATPSASPTASPRPVKVNRGIAVDTGTESDGQVPGALVPLAAGVLLAAGGAATGAAVRRRRSEAVR